MWPHITCIQGYPLQVSSTITITPATKWFNWNDSQISLDEVRRQTQFVARTNRPSNTGIPSSRNRRTIDGIPICNKCNRVGQIARNCRSIEQQFPTRLCHTRFPLGNHTMEIYVQRRNHSNKELTTHSASSWETSSGFFIPGRVKGEVFRAN
jgi:hypothetical protein